MVSTNDANADWWYPDRHSTLAGGKAYIEIRVCTPDRNG